MSRLRESCAMPISLSRPDQNEKGLTMLIGPVSDHAAQVLYGESILQQFRICRDLLLPTLQLDQGLLVGRDAG